MRHFGHLAEVYDVSIVPQPREIEGIVVGFRMDGARFGAHHAPPAFGLHPPEIGLRAGSFGTEAAAMSGLPKPVPHCLGAE